MGRENTSVEPVRIYTTSWCGDWVNAKRFLERMGVAYEEINIEKDENALEIVLKANDGRRRVPTFEIGGRYYGNPPVTLQRWWDSMGRTRPVADLLGGVENACRARVPHAPASQA